MWTRLPRWWRAMRSCPRSPSRKKALPECNITFISGADMKAKVSGYLKVLYDQNPEAVGGTLPDDAFYYGA